jgi:hydrogenase-4 component F
MSLLLVILPALAGLICFVLPSHRERRRLLLAGGVAHSLLVGALWLWPAADGAAPWLHVDRLGLFFLSVTSLLYLVSAFYAVGYLAREELRLQSEPSPQSLFRNNPEQIFCGCLLLFLAAMSLTTLAQHLGLLWFGLEATTLFSAPLIYFHRTGRSLEAMWKYLLVCSVGIALALLGTFFLAAAAGSGQSLLLSELLAAPPHGVGIAWLKLAFIFLLVGYGTKTGLAPFHTWLPDAHSEAPSVISVLLSGALLNCAMLALLRGHQICCAAGIGAFSGDLLVFFGLLSIAFATVFIVRQQDFKRLLAYSSVEHMGIIALAAGLGGIGSFAALLHALNHSCAKALLFMAAGNVLRVYRTKSVEHVSGVLKVLPVSGACWIAGFLAITGVPPFGLFVSELLIVKAALDGGRPLVAALFLVLLGVVFVAMASAVLGMTQGRTVKLSALRGYRAYAGEQRREPVLAVAPPLILAGVVLWLGLYLPHWLSAFLNAASALLGGHAL